MSSKFSYVLRTAVFSASLMTLTARSQPSKPPQGQGEAAVSVPEPTSSGYAEAVEGLRVHYKIYGKGDPIVLMAGGFGDGRSFV